jgi:nucleotide-binding universal stress UspA family protein
MYRNILVPVDLDHDSVGEGSVLLAQHIGGPEAKITLLTVTEAAFHAAAAHVPPEALEAHDKDIRARLRALARELDGGAAVVVRHGDPAREILDEAAAIGADAIVIASHRPHLRNHMLGSTASWIVKHASCSVVVDRTSV